MTTSFQTTSRAAELAPVAQALSALVAEFAELPRPYIYLFTTRPMIGIQLDDPREFELWREALAVPPTDVRLQASAASAWLTVSCRFREVEIQLSGHGVSLTQEQVNASQAVAA